MKLRQLLPLVLGLLMAGGLHAQNDPVVIEVGNEKITKSEFMHEFRKSMGLDPKAAPTACTYEKRQALEEYVELYTNFRAKLMDARALGIDSMPSIRKELAQYRNELREPYLIDSATLDRILHEAYERNHYALKAAHILVSVRADASSADTLLAYQKAMDIYRQAIAGADFEELAENKSDDPSARFNPNTKRQGNRGNLGCFTVFQMVYPFENGAYALEPGQVSLPVRSDYGYHIIKLYDKQPYFGKVTIQHIWVSGKTGNKSMIDNAYERLSKGEDIVRVAFDISSDRAEKASLTAGLEMNQMPAEYVMAIAKLKEGEFSEPFETQLGWHIVKLVKREAIPSYEDMVPLYKQRLSRDKRSQAPKAAFAEQCRQKYGFTDFTQERMPAMKGAKPQYKASLDECRAALTDSVFKKRWVFDPASVTDLRPLFQIGHRTYNAVDLLKYIERQQEWQGVMGDLDLYLADRYRRFIDQQSLKMADSLLEEENPEFRELMEEYHNGLMIFAYNDRKVWRVSTDDTARLNAFYAQTMPQHSIDNPDDAPYFWNTRAHVIEITVADSALLAPKTALKVVEKALKKGFAPNAIETLLLKVAKSPKDSGMVAVSVKTQLVEEGESQLLSKSEWKCGLYERPNEKGYSLLAVDRILDPMPKSVKEARGYYVNDFQAHLDQELVKMLREKYNVKIHQNVVDEITY